MVKKILKFLRKTLLVTAGLSIIVFLTNRDTIFTLMNPGVETTFYLTGEIDEKTASDFKFFMRQHEGTLIPASEITIDISSPGGSVAAGMQIVELMGQSRSKIHTVAREMVASMASAIFIEGDIRTVIRGSTLIFHEVRIQTATGDDLLDDDFFEMSDNVQNIVNLIKEIDSIDLAPDEVKEELLVNKGSALFKTKGKAKLFLTTRLLVATKYNAAVVANMFNIYAESMLNFNLGAVDTMHRKTGVSFSTLNKLLNNNKDNLVSPEQALDLGLATDIR